MTGLIFGIVGIIFAATASQYKAQFFLLGLLAFGITAHKEGYRIEQPVPDYPQQQPQQQPTHPPQYPDYYQEYNQPALASTAPTTALPDMPICDRLDAVAATYGSVFQYIVEAGNFNESRESPSACSGEG